MTNLPPLTPDVLRPVIQVRSSRQSPDGWYHTSASVGVSHLDGRQLWAPFGQRSTSMLAKYQTFYSDASGSKPLPAEVEAACADNLIDDVTRWFADVRYRMERKRLNMESMVHEEGPDIGKPWYSEAQINLACEEIRYAVFMGVLA